MGIGVQETSLQGVPKKSDEALDLQEKNDF